MFDAQFLSFTISMHNAHVFALCVNAKDLVKGHFVCVRPQVSKFLCSLT